MSAAGASQRRVDSAPESLNDLDVERGACSKFRRIPLKPGRGIAGRRGELRRFRPEVVGEGIACDCIGACAVPVQFEEGADEYQCRVTLLLGGADVDVNRWQPTDLKSVVTGTFGS